MKYILRRRLIFRTDASDAIHFMKILLLKF